jgi:hypothetical protein
MRYVKGTIVLVHGINWLKGTHNTVDTFQKFFEKSGYQVEQFKYDFNKDWHKGNYRRAKRLFEKYTDTPLLTVISFSNGCVLAAEAASMGLEIDNLIMFGSALDRDYIFAPTIKRVYNIYNPKDWILKLDRLFPDSLYGTLGKDGLGSIWPQNEAIMQLNADKIHKVRSRFYVHGDYFKERNREIWEGNILRWIETGPFEEVFDR